MNKKNRIILNCIFSSVISVLFLYLCSTSFLKPVVTNIFGSTNLPSFALSIIYFLLIFLLSGKINCKYTSFPAGILFYPASLFLACSLALEKREIKYPVIEFSIPTWLLISIATVLFLIFCLAFRYDKIYDFFQKILKKISRKSAEYILITVSAILILISAYNQYNLHFFTYFDYYHLHAYFNSITNVFWGQPFTETITSIYGHYAFFYYPFLKVMYHFGFHNIFKAYMILSSALIVATLLIWIRILTWNVKKPFILLLGIFAICHINAARIVYMFHQLYPHRSFPVAVTALMIALWYKTNGKRRKMITIIGYFVSMLLIIWSVEFGIFSLVSWTALHICSSFQTKEAKNIWTILIHLMAIPIVFMCAVGLCGGINILFGGEMLSVYDFVFPLLVKEHMIGFHELPLPNYPSAWMSIVFLVLCFLGFGLQKTLLYTSDCKKSDQTAACFSIAVLGLGSLTYPINRPAYTEFFIILPMAGLFMAILADAYSSDIRNFFNKVKNKNQVFQGSLGGLSMFVLIVLMISTVINIPHKLKEYEPYKNTQTIDETITWITDLEDRPNALAMGNIMGFLYAYLGWDPGFYHMDSSNFHINPNSRQEIIEKAKYLDGTSVFISNDINYDLPQEFVETHWMYSMWKNEDTTLYYWIPKN